MLLVGTDEDPQDLAAQRQRLEAAGARVFSDLEAAVAWTVERLAPAGDTASNEADAISVPLSALAGPLSAINVGLATFADSLEAQGVRAVQVDWRPPAGGDERLAALLVKDERWEVSA